MVKLIQPGLSAAASGTLANSVTFSVSKGRAYIKKKPTPKQPRSGPQVSMRAMMKFLSQQWQNLNGHHRATWTDAYLDPQLNAYNSFLRYNLERWRRRAPPTKAYPATEENTAGFAVTLNLVGGVRHVVLEMFLRHNKEDNWTILVFHSAAGTPDADFNTLIHVQEVDDMIHRYWTHSPLPTGTHYYRVVATTDDGLGDWGASATNSAVVT